ncbi:TPA: DUF550 domain-containing protein [Salmonella enterica subsp. enterica serovar Muenchen]|nr:DUF550 domain-containing protein [Salmonella enterica subsp. enterica serovar Muenchen]
MQFTKEQLTERARRKVKELEFAIAQSAFTSIRDGLKEELELARIALASLEVEPVAYIFKHPAGELFWSLTDESNKGQNDVMPVYAAPPAPERERIRREHAEWSDKTFGDISPIGPLKHLSKEALEAAAEPDDLSEWADMQFLLWDAQRRAGITDKQITQAMKEKLAVNKKREWPEPKDGEPRLHIKKHPVPVVPEEITADGIIGMHECGFVEGWNACRAAMLQGQYRDLSQPVDPQAAQYEQIMLQAGWVMVPVEPTDEMIAAAMECDDVVFDSKDPTVFCVQHREIYYAMVDAAPKPEK